MKVSDAFPSKYIKAADLQGRNVTVKIDRAEFEVIGSDKKLILYFEGKDRGMVLNRTNSNNIAVLYGDEMEDWEGKEIVLFEAMVDFQGKTVPAIRVRGPQRRSASHQAPATAPSAPPPRQRETAADILDDEIPF